jgi:leucyl aminopeptidase
MRTNLLTLEAFHNRHYQSQTGVESANWIYNNLLSIASTNPLISVSKFNNTWVQHSVIAKFQGSNPSLPIIVIGAHQDSIAGGVNGRAPGADDNGSGSVTILEVFRILASQSFAPAATVEFHWYSAEEAGLLGSKAIANKYAADGVEVAAMLNYDVVGYTAKQKVIGVVTDYVDISLTAFLRTVVTTFSIVPLKNTRCNYACSDHASWGSAGYPSGFLVEAEMSNSSPYMHTVNDVIATVDFDHLLEFAKIAIGYVVELGQTTEWAKK